MRLLLSRVRCLNTSCSLLLRQGRSGSFSASDKRPTGNRPPPATRRDLQVLAPEEIRQLEPALAPIFKRAVWFPDCANPFPLVEALAGAFLRNGGQILARRVLDLEFNAD